MYFHSSSISMRSTSHIVHFPGSSYTIPATDFQKHQRHWDTIICLPHCTRTGAEGIYHIIRGKIIEADIFPDGPAMLRMSGLGQDKKGKWAILRLHSNAALNSSPTYLKFE